MLAVTDSVFNEIGGVVKGWLRNPLNQTFLFWYFLPAAGLILLQLWLIGPALGFAAPGWLANPQALAAGTANMPPGEAAVALVLAVLSQNLILLVLAPLVLAVLLGVMSNSVVKLFEGRLAIERALLAGWRARNQRRAAAAYGDLEKLRREYFFAVSGLRLVLIDGMEQSQPLPDTERAELLEKLRQDIQALHERREKEHPLQDLPASQARVAPTALGNALAVAEEYPFERYGVDAVVFWPRLRAEIEPENLAALDSGFATLNGLLNVSLLAGLFAVEALLVGLLAPPARWGLLAASLLSAVVAAGAYRSAVSTAQAVGGVLKTLFDYYRGRVLDRFGLKMPPDLDAERLLWLRLAAFVRRGESFYFPADWRKT
jgi:hypothetical protein